MSIQNVSEKENPNSAAAVRNTLTAVTMRAPSLRVSLSENRLDTIVPPEITMETIPIYETGTSKSACMAGQPDPSRESGSPKLIKAT